MSPTHVHANAIAGTVRGLLFAMVTGLMSPAASSQVSPPAMSRQPLRIILASSPGSGMDVAARAIRDALSRALDDRPVIVENRPGAAGVVATRSLISAQPDGATIGLLSNSYVLNRSNPQSVPRDQANDEMTPISVVARSPRACTSCDGNPRTSMPATSTLPASRPLQSFRRPKLEDSISSHHP